MKKVRDPTWLESMVLRRIGRFLWDDVSGGVGGLSRRLNIRAIVVDMGAYYTRVWNNY